MNLKVAKLSSQMGGAVDAPSHERIDALGGFLEKSVRMMPPLLFQCICCTQKEGTDKEGVEDGEETGCRG